MTHITTIFTVQDMIDELQKLEDRSIPILIYLYEFGELLIDLEIHEDRIVIDAI